MKSSEAGEVAAEIERTGLLLLTDPVLPSVVGILAGAPVGGSWWAHPKAHDIVRFLHELEDDPDLIAVKLVSGKVTWVRRALWPALLAVARSRGAWQMSGLTAPALAALERVGREGQVRTDSLPRGQAVASRLLEQRLLVRGSEVHTERGAHARLLETWDRWARRAGSIDPKMTAGAGRRRLEEVVADLNARFKASAILPWMDSRPKPRRPPRPRRSARAPARSSRTAR
jgi:hypothetical protein